MIVYCMYMFLLMYNNKVNFWIMIKFKLVIFIFLILDFLNNSVFVFVYISFSSCDFFLCFVRFCRWDF